MLGLFTGDVSVDRRNRKKISSHVGEKLRKNGGNDGGLLAFVKGDDNDNDDDQSKSGRRTITTGTTNSVFDSLLATARQPRKEPRNKSKRNISSTTFFTGDSLASKSRSIHINHEARNTGDSLLMDVSNNSRRLYASQKPEQLGKYSIKDHDHSDSDGHDDDDHNDMLSSLRRLSIQESQNNGSNRRAGLFANNSERPHKVPDRSTLIRSLALGYGLKPTKPSSKRKPKHVLMSPDDSGGLSSFLPNISKPDNPDSLSQGLSTFVQEISWKKSSVSDSSDLTDGLVTFLDEFPNPSRKPKSTETVLTSERLTFRSGGKDSPHDSSGGPSQRICNETMDNGGDEQNDQSLNPSDIQDTSNLEAVMANMSFKSNLNVAAVSERLEEPSSQQERDVSTMIPYSAMQDIPRQESMDLVPISNNQDDSQKTPMPPADAPWPDTLQKEPTGILEPSVESALSRGRTVGSVTRIQVKLPPHGFVVQANITPRKAGNLNASSRKRIVIRSPAPPESVLGDEQFIVQSSATPIFQRVKRVDQKKTPSWAGDNHQSQRNEPSGRRGVPCFALDTKTRQDPPATNIASSCQHFDSPLKPQPPGRHVESCVKKSATIPDIHHNEEPHNTFVRTLVVPGPPVAAVEIDTHETQEKNTSISLDRNQNQGEAPTLVAAPDPAVSGSDKRITQAVNHSESNVGGNVDEQFDGTQFDDADDDILDVYVGFRDSVSVRESAPAEVDKSFVLKPTHYQPLYASQSSHSSIEINQSIRPKKESITEHQTAVSVGKIPLRPISTPSSHKFDVAASLTTPLDLECKTDNYDNRINISVPRLINQPENSPNVSALSSSGATFMEYEVENSDVPSIKIGECKAISESVDTQSTEELSASEIQGDKLDKKEEPIDDSCTTADKPQLRRSQRHSAKSKVKIINSGSIAQNTSTESSHLSITTHESIRPRRERVQPSRFGKFASEQEIERRLNKKKNNKAARHETKVEIQSETRTTRATARSNIDDSTTSKSKVVVSTNSDQHKTNPSTKTSKVALSGNMDTIQQDVPAECSGNVATTGCVKKVEEWTTKEVDALKVAHRSVSPTSSSFWLQVSLLVPGKTEAECRSKWFALFKTPTLKKPPPMTTSTFDKADDFFDATPFRRIAEPIVGSSLRRLDLGSAIKVNPDEICGNVVAQMVVSERNEAQHSWAPVYVPKASKAHVQNLRRGMGKAILAQKKRDRRKCNKVSALKVPRHLPKLFRSEDESDVRARVGPDGTVVVNMPDYDEDDFWDSVYGDGDDEEDM